MTLSGLGDVRYVFGGIAKTIQKDSQTNGSAQGLSPRNDKARQKAGSAVQQYGGGDGIRTHA